MCASIRGPFPHGKKLRSILSQLEKNKPLACFGFLQCTTVSHLCHLQRCQKTKNTFCILLTDSEPEEKNVERDAFHPRENMCPYCVFRAAVICIVKYVNLLLSTGTHFLFPCLNWHFFKSWQNKITLFFSLLNRKHASSDYIKRSTRLFIKSKLTNWLARKLVWWILCMKWM